MISEELRNKLLQDYDTANATIKDILEHPNHNNEVDGWGYTKPRINFSKRLPLSDEDGIFRYYCGVRDAIIVALAIGKIPKSHYKFVKHSPLEKLLIKE